MELEHGEAGDALSRMRELTSDYAIPRYACPTYSALMNGLRALETDLNQHIHLENEILFPRALQLEQQYLTGYMGQSSW
jgi:regulator of cell morphogenesis and NO signaling